MKDHSINKKLKSYSALAGSFALLGTQSDAQIIYTDVNPDSTLAMGGSFYNLDLDNNGTFDFSIIVNVGTASSFTSQQIAITPAGTNGIAGDTVGAYVYPLALNAGDTIKSTLQFNFSPSQSMASYFGPSYSYGNWLATTNKYLGLHFYIGTALHYGWARLDVSATANQFIIKDYAYNTIPDAFILAGQTGVGITEGSIDNLVSVHSSNNIVVIRFLNAIPKNAEVKITNLLGQELYTSSVTDKETSINMDQPPGIYVVTVLTNIGAYTKKVHLK